VKNGKKKVMVRGMSIKGLLAKLENMPDVDIFVKTPNGTLYITDIRLCACGSEAFIHVTHYEEESEGDV